MKSYKVLCIYQVENPNLWIILQGNLLWHVKKWNWELKGLSSSLHGWLAFWSDKFLTPLSLRFLVCQMENKNALRVVRIYVDDTDKNSAYVKCNSDVIYFNKQWLLYVSFLKILFILFLDTEEGREKRRRETSMCGCLSHIPLLGTWPPTQACALTGNWTSDPLVYRPVVNPLSYTSQGYMSDLLSNLFFSYSWHTVLC